MGFFGKNSQKGKQAKKSQKKQMYWPGETCILEPIITPSAPVVPVTDHAVNSPLLGFHVPLPDLHLATTNLSDAPDGSIAHGVASTSVHPISTGDVPIVHPDIQPLPYIYSDFCPADPLNPTDPNLFPVDPGVPGVPINPNPGTGGGIITFPVDPTNPPPIVVPVDPPGGIRFDFKKSDQPLLGIIDTGFSGNNPDIDYSNITLGHDYVGNDANPLLQNGEGNQHGTHILGVIAAKQDNGIGIDGINDKAPIWLGRATGSGHWADSLVEFVNHAKQSGQPNAVVNLSLDLTQVNPDGSVTTRYEFTPQERAALEYARQNHVLIVAAAGNDGGVMSVLGQASQQFDNIITVGSADGTQRAGYSSYGYGLDVMADGGTVEHPVLSTVGDGVGTMAGTSVAAAEVTGVVSQVWAANPGLNYRQVIDILEKTAKDLGTPGWDKQTGFGLVDIQKAVELAKATTPESHATPQISIPKTWVGEGKVTPIERAANFNGTVDWSKTAVQIKGGVNIRSGPGTTDYDIVGKISSGDTLEFDSQTEGETVYDPNDEGSSSTWYHLADGSGWMFGLYVQYLGEINNPPPDDNSYNPPPDNSYNPPPDDNSYNPPPDDNSYNPIPDDNSYNPPSSSTFSGTVEDAGYVHDIGYLRVRNGPGTDASGYQQVGVVYPGDTLTFDQQTQGEDIYDPALGDSTTWYHLADGSGWVSGLYIGSGATSSPPPSSPPNDPNSININGYTISEPFYSVWQQYQGELGNPVDNYNPDTLEQHFEYGYLSQDGNTITLYKTGQANSSPSQPDSTPNQTSDPNGFHPIEFSLPIGVTPGIKLRTDTYLNAHYESVSYDTEFLFDGWKYGEAVQDRTIANGQFYDKFEKNIFGGGGGSESSLGFPKSNEYQWWGGVRQDFEGGYIFWYNNKAEVLQFGKKPSQHGEIGVGDASPDKLDTVEPDPRFKEAFNKFGGNNKLGSPTNFVYNRQGYSVQDFQGGSKGRVSLIIQGQESTLSQTALFTTDIVFQMFPNLSYVKTNIETYLPLILSELEKVGLGDRDMVLMALATIRAETERFKPIDEDISPYNTSPGGAPFDLYDFDSETLKLGNNGVGIGAKYKGRGFVQLTGKENYQKLGKQIGVGDQLVNNPELANDPRIAAQLLARFIKNDENAIRQALVPPPNYTRARYLVNGGYHGLDKFIDAFTKGANLTA